MVEAGSVLVSHPGGAHFVYELASAVAAAGHRTEFDTGFYFDEAAPAARLLELLPRRIAERLRRELRRRQHAALDPAIVRTHPMPELAYVAAARLGLAPTRLGRVLRWRDDLIDRHVAHRVLELRPDIVIAHDGSSLHTFGAARHAGTIAILNQVIGHIASGLRILGEEAALHPEFADSLHVDAPPELVARCLAEARAADIVLAPSEYVRRTLVDQGVRPEAIRLLPYGVRAERFTPGGPRDDGVFRLLYVGQVSQRKGLKYMLEAVRRIGRKDIELVIVGGMVGSGAGLAPYRDWFRHVRNVPHAEVHRLFQSADAFLYPSLHEGSALAIYEALACGLPAIVTENAGSVVRDGIEGYVVPVRDVDAIAERIERLRTDPELRRRMAVAARARAEAFTWDTYRRGLAQILDEALAARR